MASSSSGVQRSNQALLQEKTKDEKIEDKNNLGLQIQQNADKQSSGNRSPILNKPINTLSENDLKRHLDFNLGLIGSEKSKSYVPSSSGSSSSSPSSSPAESPENSPKHSEGFDTLLDNLREIDPNAHDLALKHMELVRTKSKPRSKEAEKEEVSSSTASELTQKCLALFEVKGNPNKREGLRQALGILSQTVTSQGANLSIGDLEKAHSVFSKMGDANRSGLRAVHAALLIKLNYQGADMSIGEIRTAETLLNEMLKVKIKPSIGTKKENAAAIHFALKTKVFHLALKQFDGMIAEWPSHIGPFRVTEGPGLPEHEKKINTLTTKNIDDFITDDGKFIPYGESCSQHCFITNLLKNPAFYDLIAMLFVDKNNVGNKDDPVKVALDLRNLTEENENQAIKEIARKIDPDSNVYQHQKALFLSLQKILIEKPSEKITAVNLARTPAGPMLLSQLQEKYPDQNLEILALQDTLIAFMIVHANDIFAEVEKKQEA